MSINGLTRNSTAFKRITGETLSPSGITASNSDASFPAPGSKTGYIYTGSEPNAISVTAGVAEYVQRSRVIRGAISPASVDVFLVGGGGAAAGREALAAPEACG